MVETVTNFLFLGPKITADGDCSLEIRRWVLLVRKIMTNLDSVLKNKDITLPTKVCIVKVMVFPVVMHGCERWTIKKAESWRIDAFQLWCWRRLLRFLWTARRSNQSILKEISPEYSLEGLMVKLILQYSDHLLWRAEKDNDAGKDWRQKEKGMTEVEMVGWYHWCNGQELGQTPGDCKEWGSLVCHSPWGREEPVMTRWQNNNFKRNRLDKITSLLTLDITVPTQNSVSRWSKVVCFLWNNYH